MASIEQTAYPKFANEILAEEGLRKLFGPTEEELKFVKLRSRKSSGNLTLLILLKVHQYLGRTISLSKAPNQIQQYLSKQLELPDTIQPLEETEA